MFATIDQATNPSGVPNPRTIRDIKHGRNTKLSSVQAVAQALGLRLELVEV
jgi:DNA-binding phage protein